MKLTTDEEITIEQMQEVIDKLYELPPIPTKIKVKPWLWLYLQASNLKLLEIDKSKEIRYMGIPLEIDDTIEEDFKVCGNVD